MSLLIRKKCESYITAFEDIDECAVNVHLVVLGRRLAVYWYSLLTLEGNR